MFIIHLAVWERSSIGAVTVWIFFSII
ncbi:unnamed protein product [Spirodela intermedia]|uniref:Uncharacterized protein n=1 Tax=Spirodela intermedia TaxID=51605 RepID=A0A7I8L5M5_SPIIN|nr:unnamed protein product [Spirodela intermedia]